MTRINFIFTIIFLHIISISTYAQTNSWKGITPLLSTRADVEKLFGKPNSESGHGYKTEDEEFSFSYIDYKCESGWNAPKDTVYSIYLTSKPLFDKHYEELKLDESKFRIVTNDTLEGTWTNGELGIRYHFDGSLRFKSMSFIPKISNNNLRCNGFPNYDPEALYYPFNEFTFFSKAKKLENWHQKQSQINEFLANLNGYNKYSTSYFGYVIVYFDKNLSFKKYKSLLTQYKNYVYNFHKIPKNYVTFIEGGFTEKSNIEVYIIPKDWKPPAPTPTIPSPQFMKNKVN